MALRDDDVTAARRAASQLDQAVDALRRHYGETVDVRRLRADVARISDDLDLLCGPLAPVAVAPQAPREIIPDTSYAHDFWMDAEDEGIGTYDSRRR